ncbi:MAG: 2Fe-2S iron-sulfur cluster binding domain-containing protein [Candidatus Schekmanbacteria bacterium]|nr:2Fe-2S iron-sulfur cluster binding domain-containing protein [Candidatus Schekmanbacteria bacterium]
MSLSRNGARPLALVAAMAPDAPAGDTTLARFLSAWRASSEAVAAAEPGQACRITFARSGVEVLARPGETILQAGLRAGLDLPHSCGRGACGLCMVRRETGEVVLAQPNCLSVEDARRGFVLTCVGHARGELVVDA